MKRKITSLLFAAAAFLAVLFFCESSFNKTAEDILYHSPGGTSEKIRIIRIDDKSIQALGNYSGWDRSVYAELVEALCVSDDVKPAVIGFDIVFDSDYGTEADKAFADACAAHGNVVTAFSYIFERTAVPDENGNLIIDNMAVSQVAKPYQSLYDTTRHGFVNTIMDSSDGFVRSAFLYFDEGSDRSVEYSFGTEIYKAYAESVGFEPKFPDGSVFNFRYSGKSGEYEAVSLCDVLNGTIPPQSFDNCIVLVGAYTSGMMDSHRVPVDYGQQMYGVEIQANVIQALLENKFIYTVSPWISAIAYAALAAALAWLCGRLSVIKVSLVCIAAAAADVLAGFALFEMCGYSGDVVIFPAICIVEMAYFIAAHYYTANRTKTKIENAFRKYVAPQIVADIAKKGTYELVLGGETRDIAVLFVDIRGFTPLSEKLPPQQVVEILNEYLKLTTSCIFRHGGTLDKFIGDAAMAVFNSPFDTEDYVYKAVLTAWDIVREGRSLTESLAEKHGVSVGFGVGVNCGPAVVGNIGCEFRMDYTAIGDTVNTAARLEANAPAGCVYISSGVYESVKERVRAEAIGEIPLKGKSKGVFVYSVKDVTE